MHRDLKPENVLRGQDGRLKVVDFGIARVVGGMPAAQAGLTLTGTHLGTPGYMAPEQLRGQPADARVDIFAFGVMAYELATGSHPFGGSDPAALLERLVSDDPPLSRPINPPGLDAIIRTCLKGSPAGRFASGQELLLALRALQTGTARGHRAAAQGPRTAWWWQFHQLAVAVLTITAVTIIWIRRPWIGQYGSPVFLVDPRARDHLHDPARAHVVRLAGPAGPARRAARARPALGRGLRIAAPHARPGYRGSLLGTHDGTAAQLVIIALLLLLSLLVIEPATTRASLPCLTEGLRPSDSPARALARRCAASLNRVARSLRSLALIRASLLLIPKSAPSARPRSLREIATALRTLHTPRPAGAQLRNSRSLMASSTLSRKAYRSPPSPRAPGRARRT